MRVRRLSFRDPPEGGGPRATATRGEEHTTRGAKVRERTKRNKLRRRAGRVKRSRRRRGGGKGASFPLSHTRACVCCRRRDEMLRGRLPPAGHLGESGGTTLGRSGVAPERRRLWGVTRPRVRERVDVDSAVNTTCRAVSRSPLSSVFRRISGVVKRGRGPHALATVCCGGAKRNNGEN